MRIKTLFIVITTFLMAGVISGCQGAVSQKQKILSEEELEKWNKDSNGLTSEYSTNYPLLNVYVDNPKLGNEFNFVRIAPWDDENPTDISTFQSGEFTLEAGKSYAVMIFYHNAADVEVAADGVAKATVLAVDYPETMQAGDEDMIIATFAYGEGELPSIRVAGLSLTADEDLRLRPGVILPGADPEYCAMLCDYYGENWVTKNPSADVTDNHITQVFRIGDIAPQDDGAGFVFLKLDAVAVE